MYTKEYNNCGKNQNLDIEKFYTPNLDAGSRDARYEIPCKTYGWEHVSWHCNYLFVLYQKIINLS